MNYDMTNAWCDLGVLKIQNYLLLLIIQKNSKYYLTGKTSLRI